MTMRCQGIKVFLRCLSHSCKTPLTYDQQSDKTTDQVNPPSPVLPLLMNQGTGEENTLQTRCDSFRSSSFHEAKNPDQFTPPFRMVAFRSPSLKRRRCTGRSEV